MNAPTNGNDKFSALMTMRVEPLTIEGLPPLEIREQPLGMIKPLLDRAADMPSNEFTNQLLGLSLFLDGEQLTYARVQQMGLSTVQKLMPAIPKIMQVYGLKIDADEPAPDEAAAPDSEAAAPGSEAVLVGTYPPTTVTGEDDDDDKPPPKPKKKD